MEQITMVQVEQLHPHEKNPRIDAASVAELVESIKEHGIEVPLVAAPHPTDGYVVLGGHRRLTAALQVGLTEVPAQIREDLTDARDQLTFIATENLHRDQLTVLEESRLVQDMLDLGMTQAQVAKQTALAKQRVSERVKLSKLAEDAGDKLHRGQITVDDALVIAEYSDDPETAQELEESAGTPRFDYAVSAARRRREDKKRIADGKKQIKKEGLRLADTVVTLDQLVESGLLSSPALDAAAHGSDDEQWQELQRSEHESCPGHSAVALSESRWIRGLGHVLAGTVIIGCDDHETHHPDTATTEEPEPDPDPWAELDAEDFATAKIHRERHLAGALPSLDLHDDALDITIRNVLAMGWGDYVEDEAGIALLQAITGHEGKTKVQRALRHYPLSVLVWLGENRHNLIRDHRCMTLARPGSTYWDRNAKLRQLLDRTDYAWTTVEQQAILLATGKAHDATDDAEAGAALAEGGEAA